MEHNFKPGERVQNGRACATVARVIADDFLEVTYDHDADQDKIIECASYFKLMHIKPNT